MSKVDYKVKYKELRNQWIQSLETVYRDGYAQGYQAAQMDAAAQQANQMAQMMGGMQQQPPGEEGEAPEEMSPMDQVGQETDQMQETQGVSELEAGMQELEELLSKSEGMDKAAISMALKSLNGSLHKVMQAKESQSLRKSLNDIKKKTTPKLSASFKANASPVQKQAVNTQQKIISGIMKKWEKEEKEAASDILSALKKD